MHYVEFWYKLEGNFLIRLLLQNFEMDKFIIIFLFLKVVSGLTNSDLECIKDHSTELSNDFLIGRWYKVYKFAYRLNLIASSECLEVNIAKPSTGEVERYREAHGLDAGYSFDDNPMLFNRTGRIYEGMILRNTEMKFFVFDPSSAFFRANKYESRVYRKISDDFVLFNTCAIRSTKWLLSRKKDLTQAELLEVISTIDEVKTLETQRFCA